jgi:hypothetical protein
MGSMNEIAELRLRALMEANEGWGRTAGRETYRKLVDFVESNPGALIFRVSLVDVKRVDISFASETVVELARRYRAKKGFCIIDLTDKDMEENWSAAAERAKQPMMVWAGNRGRVIGIEPSQGIADAFRFTLTKGETRASDYAAKVPGVSITNASTKFKQLWEQGFLLRRERTAESGGVEFVYVPIR